MAVIDRWPTFICSAEHANQICQSNMTTKICLLSMLIKFPKYTSSKYPYIWFKFFAERSVISSVTFNTFCFPIPCAYHCYRPDLRFKAFFEMTSLIYVRNFYDLTKNIYWGNYLKSNFTLLELISGIAWNKTIKKYFFWKLYTIEILFDRSFCQ